MGKSSIKERSITVSIVISKITCEGSIPSALVDIKVIRKNKSKGIGSWVELHSYTMAKEVRVFYSLSQTI